MAQNVVKFAAKDNPWATLTWDDLEEALDARTLAKGKSYRRRVSELAQDGRRLLAWVTGTRRYATCVELTGRKTLGLQSECSCPIGGSCKHVAAVVLVFLEALKEGTPVLAAAESDSRWAIARGEESDMGDELDDDPDNVRESPARKGKSAERLTTFLQAKSKDELVALARQLLEQLPTVRAEILEKRALAEGDAAELVERARRLIDKLTAEPAWRHHWDNQGSVPDYSGLHRLLQHLLDAGQADALLELGKRLMEKGIKQVEQSDDEGETAGEITQCLNIIFKAVLPSKLPDVEKLLYVIDLESRDDYELTQGADVVWNRSWPKSVWSLVADALIEKLRATAVPSNDWNSSYKRNGFTGTIMGALDDAGRGAEATALALSEAKLTGSYVRAVGRLIAERRWDEARQWATDGIANVNPKLPGIIADLRKQLAEIAKANKDWPTVAAERAEEFFDRPSVGGWEELVKAAKKAGCAEAVAAASLQFLETAKRPDRGRTSREYWPLPALPQAKPDPRPQWRDREQPHYAVLIDLAIKNKDLDEALRWYDAWRKPTQGSFSGSSYYDDRIAAAVAASHPNRSLAIRLRQIDQLVHSSRYDDAGKLIRAVRPLFESLGRVDDWPKLIAKLREEHRRRRNFMTVLDRMEKKPIVAR